jgi:LPS export ABC transporter protein LptC
MKPFWADAAAGACVVIAISCASVTWSEEVASPSFELEGMTFVSSQAAENEVVLVAERAHVETRERVAHLEKVRAQLASGRETSGLDMTCDRGRFYFESSDFDAEGDVRGTTGDGRRFRTARLHYSHSQGLVSTNSQVVIDDETGTYRGGGFRYHVRENRFQLTHGATVEQQ